MAISFFIYIHSLIRCRPRENQQSCIIFFSSSLLSLFTSRWTFMKCVKMNCTPYKAKQWKYLSTNNSSTICVTMMVFFFFFFRLLVWAILNPNFVCKYKYFMSVQNRKWQHKMTRKCTQCEKQTTMIIPILLMRLLSFFFMSPRLLLFSLSIRAIGIKVKNLFEALTSAKFNNNHNQKKSWIENAHLRRFYVQCVRKRDKRRERECVMGERKMGVWSRLWNVCIFIASCHLWLHFANL